MNEDRSSYLKRILDIETLVVRFRHELGIHAPFYSYCYDLTPKDTMRIGSSSLLGIIVARFTFSYEVIEYITFPSFDSISFLVSHPQGSINER